MDPVNLTIVRSKASLLCHLETLGDEIRSQTPTLTQLYYDPIRQNVFIYKYNTILHALLEG